MQTNLLAASLAFMVLSNKGHYLLKTLAFYNFVIKGAGQGCQDTEQAKGYEEHCIEGNQGLRKGQVC